MSVIKNPKFKTAMYLILSFIMAMCILACCFLSVIRFTVLNSDFLTDTLSKTNYYSDLSSEINENLVDLGSASGLDKSFFDNFVDESQLQNDVEIFISDFYAGDKLKTDTKEFQEKLESSLDDYITQNSLDISSVPDSSIDYFLKEASDIYANGVKVNYFSQVQKTVVGLIPKCNLLILLTGLLVAAIAAFIFFTSEWKHIAIRHIYYSTTSSGLFLLAIPVIVFLSGMISKLTVLTRSLNDMYTACLKSVFIVILIIAILLIGLSAGLWILHNSLRKKASS